ncbi:dinucleotide-utilizing enzyme possibly involved in molybdopterin or thiamin biosynthesis [Desulfocurvibacter africanus PCS]|uniref:Dinucleotide-utilizing enzyme possibly involved in molybdopterin or thiamin biosynthesis n=1 Tax=Desulfocurvibacter africanus PCS TaxID=1262666 RepID=M5PX95_DESAF|nr:ThiF family adenylyltransferase [Desulfocurvibacter africanus]EMG38600.1 dinucleotide-utilizing enzyme possibly involved in molybdopterin or thiamin biosynthesis [Desulfocurvibacter africanus PCS]
MQAWWETCPERLEFEIQALERAGYKVERVDEAFEAGAGALRLSKGMGGLGQVQLEVLFPFFYPYFRFKIIAKNLQLAHHQNPFDKHLCLLSGEPEAWNTTDTVAQVLGEMLPKLLVAGASQDMDEATPLEVDQAEPFTAYYPFGQSSVLWDSDWTIPADMTKGRLRIGVREERRTATGQIDDFSAAVLEVMDMAGMRLAGLRPELADLHRRSEVEGYWVRMQSAIEEIRPLRLLEVLCKAYPNLERTARGGKRVIIGVLFPEEVRRREYGDGWIFLMVDPVGKRGKKGNHYYLLRPMRAGMSDLSARLPYFPHLQDKLVALVGLGCIGAPSAIEFARNGVGTLRLLDGDTVDAAVSGRWPLGVSCSGKSKTLAIKEFVEQHYPWTKIHTLSHPLGEVSVDWAQNKEDAARIEEFLDKADLVLDSSANLNLGHLLSDFCRRRGIPYMGLALTMGVWGGHVLRIEPASEGCWMCYRLMLEDGAIRPANSADDTTGRVQPRGCAAPTYTGSSFDAHEVIMAGVRMAISTLTAGAATQYPAIPWDAAVVNLRDENGAAIAPKWETYKVEQHPRCPCAKKAG